MDQFLSENPLDKIRSASKDGDINWPAVNDFLNNYQNANEASSIALIQQELDETKIILHKAIDSVRSPSTPPPKIALFFFFAVFFPEGLTVRNHRSFNVARNWMISWPKVLT